MAALCATIMAKTKFRAAVPPVIAVPNHLRHRIGSDASGRDRRYRTGTKVGISSPYLIPRGAICDPELTLTCPPALHGASGADALTHAIGVLYGRAPAPTPDLTVKKVFVGKNALSTLRPAVNYKHLPGPACTAVKGPARISRPANR